MENISKLEEVVAYTRPSSEYAKSDGDLQCILFTVDVSCLVHC